MGPLAGLKVVELGGIGPGPMCAMLLADLGATVLRIDSPKPRDWGLDDPLHYNFLLRGRTSLVFDLKQEDAKALALSLVDRAEALIEGYRPGVAERLGLGPDACLERNPGLVYGRVTGWGQDGPLAQSAGHDINYIALTGALHAIGRRGQPPTPPANLIGDYAAGALYLAFGIVCAILEARRSGQGQVIDAAMVDGVASLMTGIHGMVASGLMRHERGTNLLDGGAHFYNVYECADGGWISVGAIEDRFYTELLSRLDIDPATLPPQMASDQWSEAQEHMAAVFRTRTRDEWCTLLEGTDACFAPVLTTDEAPRHPHLAARGTYIEVGGIVQPAPAPRFSRSIPATPTPPRRICGADDIEEALRGWLDPDQIAELRETGALRRLGGLLRSDALS